MITDQIEDLQLMQNEIDRLRAVNARLVEALDRISKIYAVNSRKMAVFTDEVGHGLEAAIVNADLLLGDLERRTP